LMEPSRKPLNTLLKSLHNHILIKLKNGVEYKGKMTQCDNYMNVILEGATEVHEGQSLANYGNVFIRGNNILYIRVDLNRAQ